jgi:chromosome segregation ATPase
MKVTTLLLTAACMAAAPAAWAQSPPKPATVTKPAPSKPTIVNKQAAPEATAAPAADKTLSLGSGKPGGPLLSRDELRACLSQEESIRTRLADAESHRAVMNQEKAALGAEQQELRNGRAAVDDLKKQADDLSARMKDYGGRVESWNQRVLEFNSNNKSTPQSERQRNEINRERDELEKQQKALEAEKASFASSSDATLKVYNGKATALDAKVVDWNQRNEQWNTSTKALEAERATWVAGCADRRYREDDETAIRKGK